MHVNDPSIDYKTFFKRCSDTRDWHEEYENYMKFFEDKYKMLFFWGVIDVKK